MIGADPFSGHLFIFRGKRGDYFKGLYWDGTGLWLIAKRLEKGRFVWPPIVDGGDDADAGAVLIADRGDGLAAHDSTAAASPTNAGLTTSAIPH
jgi:transposase